METKRKNYLKKLVYICLIVALICPVVLTLSGCSLFEESQAYIMSIVKSDSTETSDTYTVVYSDGTTATFTTENGTDGQDLTIGDIYQYCCANNIFNPNDYKDDTDAFCAFLKAYLSNSTESVSSLSATTKALYSAVSVYSFFPLSSRYGYTFYYSSYGTTYVNASTGAGIVYLMETDGIYSYIVTCYHVVFSTYTATSDGIGSEIYLFQYGDTPSFSLSSDYFDDYTTRQITTSGIAATYVGGSINYDLAVLRVETSDLASWTQEVEIADGYDLGDTVYAVGNPEDEGISVTEGIINVLSETVSASPDNVNSYTYRVLRTDAAVNSGNSGGGLFNAKGEFLGIVNIKSESSDIDNMAYAIPYDNVTKVVNNILANMTDGVSLGVYKLYIGVGVMESNSRAELSETGALVLYDDCEIYLVNEDSLAASIGLQVGDIVKSVTIEHEGISTTYDITHYYMLSEVLLDVREGDSVLFKFTRDGVEGSAYIDSASASNFVVIA